MTVARLAAVAGVLAASPSPLPGGDVDGDPADWSGAPWIIGAVLLLAVVIAGGVIVARVRTHRSDQQR